MVLGLWALVFVSRFEPRSGYGLQPNVAAPRLRWVGMDKRTQPHRGCGGLELDTQGSRSGNPGLEVITASRYLMSLIQQTQIQRRDAKTKDQRPKARRETMTKTTNKQAIWNAQI